MVNISTLNLRVIKETSCRYDIDSKIISSPKEAVRVFNEVYNLNERAEEILVLMTLDTKNKVTGMFQVSQGAIDMSIVHPREIFKRALLQNAASIMIAHNHPSGDPKPSKDDINITIRLQQAGDIIGIKLLDHIVIGSDNNTFLSMKQKVII